MKCRRSVKRSSAQCETRLACNVLTAHVLTVFNTAPFCTLTLPQASTCGFLAGSHVLAQHAPAPRAAAAQERKKGVALRTCACSPPHMFALSSRRRCRTLSDLLPAPARLSTP